MLDFISILIKNNSKDTKEEDIITSDLSKNKIICKHEYEYKAHLQDNEHFPISNSPFYRELVFRCKHCGKHISLYGFDLKKEFNDLIHRNVESGHENFRIEVPNIIFEGNEAYKLYKRYLRKGIDLTKVKPDTYKRYTTRISYEDINLKREE